GIDWAGLTETKAEYAFHLLLGHHGLFALTPVYLLGLAGSVAALFGLLRRKPSGGREPPEPAALCELASLTCLLAGVVVGFYVSRSSNYGGWTNGPRWLMWLTPLWLLALVPVADRLAASRGGRAFALLLLALSVLSASYVGWNPWRHPWI